MRTEKQKYRLHRGLKLAAIGTIAIGLAGCVVYPDPPPPRAQYTDGYYSYYDYPHYYRDYDYSSAYSGDYDAFNANRNADERNGLGHSDDRNFHDRDDYEQYDR
jgi:hypothetical protein